MSLSNKDNAENNPERAVKTKKSLDDYEVVLENGQEVILGRGSFGYVRLAKEKSTGKEVALKMIPKKHLYQHCSVENIKREIKLHKKIDHPHIIKLYAYFEDKDGVYLILEYAPKGSLFHHLRVKKRFSESEAFVYFLQTCLAVDYLHKKNILHRDIKPENLLLDENSNVKICDFGWSAEGSSQYQKRTTFCGTIDYMPPEMIQNKPHDFSLDIWCLGIFLYEILHGYTPFNKREEAHKSPNLIYAARLKFDFDLSPEVRDLITRLLKPMASERLLMDQIFNHAWVQKLQKSFKIEVWDFVYSAKSERRHNTLAAKCEPNLDPILEDVPKESHQYSSISPSSGLPGNQDQEKVLKKSNTVHSLAASKSILQNYSNPFKAGGGVGEKSVSFASDYKKQPERVNPISARSLPQNDTMPVNKFIVPSSSSSAQDHGRKMAILDKVEQMMSKKTALADLSLPSLTSIPFDPYEKEIYHSERNFEHSNSLTRDRADSLYKLSYSAIQDATISFGDRGTLTKGFEDRNCSFFSNSSSKGGIPQSRMSSEHVEETPMLHNAKSTPQFDKYIFTPTEVPRIRPPVPEIQERAKPPERNHVVSEAALPKRGALYFNDFVQRGEDEDERVSRVSIKTRNQEAQKLKVEASINRKDSLLDRILHTLGCVTRGKGQ
eukprot:TRINITY_DN12544_c0_g4_i1.p1 TRINITY_DN12544_c0_g4~~TRINITY_DN12544_c0_g4_i1.p1  ORF type:complete len:664 (-),score=113.79 TRINITY_DN12544_c0_g4_i1:74-2065(-)